MIMTTTLNVMPAWTADPVSAPPDVIARQEAAVQRGALLLDDVLPNWWDVIDLDALSLRRGTECVLGQIGLCPKVDVGAYYEALGWLADVHNLDVEMETDDGIGFASAHGFFADTRWNPSMQADDRWSHLDKAWAVVILDRRAVAAAQR